MTRVEHSQLVFLVDALRANPSQATALLRMESRAKRPAGYRATVQRLQEAVENGTLEQQVAELYKELY